MKKKLNSERYFRLAREGGWIVAGQMATVLGTLALVRVLTEHLDPAQYGQLALGLTVAGLANQIVMGGVGSGIGRFYAIAAEKLDLGGYLRASLTLMAYATLAVVIIGLVLMVGLVGLGYSQWMGLVAAVLVFSVLSGYSSTLSGIQNAARQRSIVAFHNGSDAWLKIFLTLGVLFLLGSSSTAVAIGYAVSSLLITGSQLFFLNRLVPAQITHSGHHNDWSRQMWSYSWPFSVFGIFTGLQLVSDRWALEAFATTADVGLYAVLFQLGYTPVSMATGMAMSFIGPILYQRSGDASDHSRNADVHQLAWRIMLACLLLTLVGFLLSLGLHEWIFRLIVAAEFRSISYLLPWMVLAGGLFATGQMLALKLMSDMRPAVMTQAKIITALLGVCFNLYGVSVAGLHGIVGAQIAFSAIFLTWMALLAFRVSANIKK